MGPQVLRGLLGRHESVGSPILLFAAAAEEYRFIAGVLQNSEPPERGPR
jgi:hypothetical protein